MSEAAVAGAGPRAEDWGELLVFFRELNDLKRIQTPEYRPSLAAIWFRSLARLMFHDPRVDWHQQAIRATAQAVAATRLGGIQSGDLQIAGLESRELKAVFERALLERECLIEADLFAELRRASFDSVPSYEHGPTDADQNDWIERLVGQPRAGATAPGAPRLILEPVESCAEHCYVTAIYAVLLAPYFGASIGAAFAIGLAHHAHNARLADAGFAGEALLDDYLDRIITTLRQSVLATMTPVASDRVAGFFDQIAAADTPLARTFHTADTIDRVLQIEYFERVNAFTLKTALVDMELVHAGPVQAFQNSQLRAAGLID